MKSRSFKLLSLVLLSCSLVACGGSESNDTAKKDGTVSADSEAPKATEKVEKTGVALKIEQAEEMTFSALVEKAKEEVGTNEVKVLGNSSSISKACNAFTEAYGIKFTYEKTGDSDLYKNLSAAIPAGTYLGDFVFAQDGNSMKSLMLDTGYLLNYTPLDYKDVLSDDDKTPATGGIAFNKVFMYNNTDYDGTNADSAKAGALKNKLTNVWQLAGSASDANHISNVSFKDPSQENINMNMLIMLTSPSMVSKLTDAYKSYYGKDYTDEADYENIGYKFIKEFLNNIVYHESDGTECKDLAKGSSGKFAYINYNKTKDLKGSGIAAEDVNNLTTAVEETTVEGFGGFVYKMYPLIPNNAKYPFAACAFENYILSENGYKAGWDGMKGYYSVNPNNKCATGDHELSWWKERCVIEDPTYVVENYNDVSEFITTNKKQ